jgi:hypothetical protein
MVDHLCCQHFFFVFLAVTKSVRPSSVVRRSLSVVCRLLSVVRRPSVVPRSSLAVPRYLFTWRLLFLNRRSSFVVHVVSRVCVCSAIVVNLPAARATKRVHVQPIRASGGSSSTKQIAKSFCIVPHAQPFHRYCAVYELFLLLTWSCLGAPC